MQWKTIDSCPEGKEVLTCFVRRYDCETKPTVYGPWTAQFVKGKWWASWDDCLVVEYMSDFGTDYKQLDIDPTHWMDMPEVARIEDQQQ